MSLTRTGSRKSTSKKKIEKHELKGAYIIPQENGDKIIQDLAELPIKYSKMVGPIIDSMQKAFRGDITIMVDPNKEAPPIKAPAPAPEAKIEVKKGKE